MLAGKTRKNYEEVLINPILTIKRERKQVEEIKSFLFRRHSILEGNTQSVINNPREKLADLDWRVLVLLGQQVYRRTGIQSTDPEKFYTTNEIKKALQYTGKLTLKEDVVLPFTFDEVIRIDYNKYLTTIDIKTLAQMSSLLLNYNFDIQRESKIKIVGGETIREATLVMKNVLEIKENLKRGVQEVTNIVINASVGTSDSDEEIVYDEKNNTLTITKGTRLDIVDGYHRCKASELAINENPDIDFKFGVLLLNYTDDQAAKYQGQLAKSTPITESRQKQLSEDRYADIITNNLNRHSELRGKISNNPAPSLHRGELVSYNILSDTINSEFKLKRMYEVHKTSEFLINYFDYLIGYYEEQFLTNPSKYKKETLMLDNNMFIGYVVLAKRMMDNNIHFSEVVDYLDKINFERDNALWKELGILDEKGNLTKTNKARSNIKKFFYSIDLK